MLRAVSAMDVVTILGTAVAQEAKIFTIGRMRNIPQYKNILYTVCTEGSFFADYNNTKLKSRCPK